MAEINGQDNFLEFVHVLNHEGTAVLVPLNDAPVLFILNRNMIYLKNFESLRNKYGRSRRPFFPRPGAGQSFLPIVATPVLLVADILFS